MKKRTCIMAIDDEEEILRLLKNILEEEGYDFVGATGGDSAFPLMHECQPDLIILDIMMPGLDGFQVLNLIRRKSQVPVIMLTGKGEMSTLRESVEIGADDFIRKPFYPLELVARVRAKLRRAAQSNSQSRDMYNEIN
ncbi:MAG: response regulator transcription factor [Dehalococcoidia bacterium]|nr:response regulator transcription factor [Dehalococcoidia bacterium]